MFSLLWLLYMCAGPVALPTLSVFLVLCFGRPATGERRFWGACEDVLAGIWGKSAAIKRVDGSHEAGNAHKYQGAAAIIGRRCHTELAPDIFNTAREKVPLPHPFLTRATLSRR